MLTWPKPKIYQNFFKPKLNSDVANVRWLALDIIIHIEVHVGTNVTWHVPTYNSIVRAYYCMHKFKYKNNVESLLL